MIVRNDGHNLISEPFAFGESFQENPNLTGLEVEPDRTLALIGGNIFFDGGILKQPGGQIEIGAVNNGIVKLNNPRSRWNFNYEEVSTFKDIRLSNESLIDANGIIPSFINVGGRNIVLDGGSFVRIKNQNSQINGDLTVNASDTLDIKGISNNFIRSSLRSEAFGTGKGANINIFSKQVFINIGEIITTTNSSNSGNVNLFTQNMTILNGGRIGTLAFFDSGQAGDLNIRATENNLASGVFPFFVENISSFNSDETLILRGNVSTSIASNNFLNTLGEAGDINISTKELTLTEGATINSFVNNISTGGNLTLKASESINIIGSFGIVPGYVSAILAITQGAGDGGAVDISGQQLRIKDGGTVGTTTNVGRFFNDTGNAGNVLINVRDSIEINGTSQQFSF